MKKARAVLNVRARQTKQHNDIAEIQKRKAPPGVKQFKFDNRCIELEDPVWGASILKFEADGALSFREMKEKLHRWFVTDNKSSTLP